MIERLKKYCGVIPAFYACYEDDSTVSAERSKKLARLLVDKGVKGLYVGGSSCECIYLEKEERMKTLEAVMDEVRANARSSRTSPATTPMRAASSPPTRNPWA